MQRAACMHTPSVHAPSMARPLQGRATQSLTYGITSMRTEPKRPSSLFQAQRTNQSSTHPTDTPLPLIMPSIVIPPPSRGSQYLERRGERDKGQGGGGGGADDGGRSGGGSGGNSGSKSGGAKNPNWGRRLRALILYLVWSCCVYFLLNSFVAVCHAIVRAIAAPFSKRDGTNSWGAYNGIRSRIPSSAVTDAPLTDALNTAPSLGSFDPGLAAGQTEEAGLSGLTTASADITDPSQHSAAASQGLSSPSQAAAAVASIGSLSAHQTPAIDQASKGSPTSDMKRSIRQSSVSAPPFSATSPPHQTTSDSSSPSSLATLSAASISGTPSSSHSIVSHAPGAQLNVSAVTHASPTQGNDTTAVAFASQTASQPPSQTASQSKGAIPESKPEVLAGTRPEHSGSFGSSNPSFGVGSLVQNGVEGAVPSSGPSVMYPTLSLYVMILGGVALFRSVM